MLKVVGLNPNTWIDIFSHVIVWKNTNKQKRGRGWPIFIKKTSQYSSSIGPQVQLCRPQASIMHTNNLFRPCFTLHTRGHDIEGKISYIVLDTKKILSCTIVMWRHCLPFMQCPLVVNTFTTFEPSLRVYGSKVLNDWENVSFSI